MIFNVGDNVLYVKYNKKAKVIEVIENSKKPYKIEFLNPNMSPKTMLVSSKEIELSYNGRCSECMEEWSVTYAPVSGDEWIYCKKCNKTREEIINTRVRYGW